jgi:hypothetical protein
MTCSTIARYPCLYAFGAYVEVAYPRELLA